MDVNEVVEEWAIKWEGRYKTKPFIHWGKDQKLAKELLKQLDKQQVLKSMERYFEDDGEFASRARHSFQFFYSQINRYMDNSSETGRY